HDMLIELMEGVEDIPGAILHEGLSWDWETFPEYMDVLARRQFDVDVGAQIPHAALRVYVMGQRGADREPATPNEIAEMRRIVAEGVNAGALGVSTSRFLNHRSSKGEHTPSLTAGYDELLGLAHGLKDAGRGVFEMVSELEDLDEEFSFFRGMVSESGRPMSVSLAQGLNACGWRAVLGKIEQANADGLVMRGQVAPRPIGVLMGLTTTICPFSTRKAYKEIAALPVAERIEAMGDPARRAAILAGEPSPGFAVMHGLKDAGRGVFEMVSELEDLDEEFSFFRGMVSESGRPMSVSLAQGLNACGWRAVLGKIEQANADGLVMRGQVAPRPIGVLMGLTTTICPFSTRKAYKEIAALPVAERIEAMGDPARRAAILAGEPSPGFAVMQQKMDGGHKVWLLGDPPDYEPAPESSMAARAAAAGRDAWSYIYDRLIENDGRNIFYSPFANYEDNNLDCCREMILHENTVMGLGDGGAHVGTICDASFITTLFTHWGRDRDRGERIDLPTLVKSQTHDTARAVDLHDRGVVAPGMKADLNVIDFDNLNMSAPEMVRDLPAGGWRFEQRTSGYLATVVSGEVTYRNGEATNALPGRLIR
ncbi:MAG: amidohydrolase family protein, partial [Gammaproteobacteria bacterium]|nr:amidohydrolase family protein [Gammaproteobacteria bacterium]